MEVIDPQEARNHKQTDRIKKKQNGREAKG
jgi:hypothetical protein